jgi:hypothetical protein
MRLSCCVLGFSLCGGLGVLGQVGPVIAPINKVIFPHVAAGGGWETELILTNTSTIAPAILVTVSFFDQAGKVMTVRATKTLGDGAALSGAPVPSFQTPIWGGGVTRVLLSGDDSAVQVGWARIWYSSASIDGNVIDGQSIFRQRAEGRPDFEASVPLSSMQDWIFTLPFDNRNGFVTAIALVNPGAKTVRVRMGLLRFNGAAMARNLEAIDLAPGQQVAFNLPDRFAEAANEAGTLVVQGDQIGFVGGTLSGFGLRFSPGGAFTTLPVMNRPEMWSRHPEVP